MPSARCRKEFYLAARQTVPQVAPEIRGRTMLLAEATTASAQFAPADQLAAQLMKVRAANAFTRDGKTPTDIRSVALATADKMLAAKMEPYVRAGVVNSAINIFIALDDWEKARVLLTQEAQTSNTPHYYIGDLADVEEHLGNKERALQLMAEAYEKAKGPASRFQWGFSYLDGLLRLAPDDAAKIDTVGKAVMAELDGPNRVHRRTLSRLKRLNAALAEWNNSPARAAVVANLRNQLLAACAKSPGDSAVSTGCNDFGAAKAAS